MRLGKLTHEGSLNKTTSLWEVQLQAQGANVSAVAAAVSTPPMVKPKETAAGPSLVVCALTRWLCWLSCTHCSSFAGQHWAVTQGHSWSEAVARQQGR